MDIKKSMCFFQFLPPPYITIKTTIFIIFKSPKSQENQGFKDFFIYVLTLEKYMSIYNISTEKEETKEYIVILSIVIPSVGYDQSDFLIREQSTKTRTMTNKYLILKLNCTCKIVGVSKRRGGLHQSLTIPTTTSLVTSSK